jgi:hypothetical protein
LCLNPSVCFRRLSQRRRTELSLSPQGPLYPIAYLIVAFGLAFKWLATRFAMRHWYGQPPSVDQDMMMSLRWRMGNMAGVALLVKWWALNTASGDSGLYVWCVTIETIALGVYVVLPLHKLKSFQRFDQLTEIQDDLYSTDTGGLTFEQAAKLNGLPMPRYICPALSTYTDEAFGASVKEARKRSTSGTALLYVSWSPQTGALKDAFERTGRGY